MFLCTMPVTISLDRTTGNWKIFSPFIMITEQLNCVDSFSHLGHIITSNLDDCEDILQKRNCFIGQINNVLCFFEQLNCATKIELFKSYCSSIFGSELWSLNDPGVVVFCIAWRKSLRRVMCLPPATHCYLLPLLSGTLPIFAEICKCSARFVLSCLFSRSSLVRFITRHGIAARYDSVIGRNALMV